MIGRIGQPGDGESEGSVSTDDDQASDEISQVTDIPDAYDDMSDLSSVEANLPPGDIDSDSDMDMGGSPDGQSSFVGSDAPWMMSL